ncbi:MAG: hypothetical protein ACPGRE_04795 [Flavobacteriaceae bacterium]
MKTNFYILIVLISLSCQSQKDHDILLSEHSINKIEIPFEQKTVVPLVKKTFPAYEVSDKIGQQDGPNYRYISIDKGLKPQVYLKFKDQDSDTLDEIRLLTSASTDQYGLSVGDSYSKIISLRKVAFKNVTDYHQHTYLYAEDSNIYYELHRGEMASKDWMLNPEKLILSDKELQSCSIKAIVWRERN